MDTTQAIAFLFVAVISAGSISAQESPHPQKKVYVDVGKWPKTAPGSVKLKNFQPFRAVYNRHYTQGSGPKAGEKRQDRVIVHAEAVGWEGRQAAAITVLDSGNAKHSDTNARTMTRIIDRTDLSVLFELAPVSGTAKDYYIALFGKQKALINVVQMENQKLQPMKVEAGKPGFGAGSWVMACMDLSPKQRILLEPYYSRQTQSLSRSNNARVLKQTKFIDDSGKDHEAWVVETCGWYSLSSPKVLRLYVQNSPPYDLGTEIYNYDTGKGKHFVWLRDSQVMKS